MITDFDDFCTYMFVLMTTSGKSSARSTAGLTHSLSVPIANCSL